MKTPNEKLKKELFPTNLVMCGYRGSYAQNTYIPNTDPNSVDDVDLMGVYLAPVEYYLGLGRGKRYKKAIERFINEWDVVSYEIRKFFNLLLKSNPNVLSMLWIKKEHHLEVDYPEARNLIIANRDVFSSKYAYNSFIGYARSQASKMENHAFEGYMGEKRKNLVKKYGYDTKNASHLVRLMTMAIEFILTGEMNVYREKDGDFFKDIKIGKYKLEEVKDMANALFSDAREALKVSPLPPEPDYDAAEKIIMTILMEYVKTP
jgi:predicted nucleotidyltransferase